MTTLGTTGIEVSPLCLGGNVFGWTADEATSMAVLDAYVAGGGNFVDTANQYSFWADGNRGGESEALLGRWMRDRGNRERIVLATKVGGEMPGLPHDLRPETIERAANESLERLQTDRIDLYYAHFDDESTPLEDTLRAFDRLVREGLVGHIAASNYGAGRLAEALAISEREGLARFSVFQPHYNLLEREFEQELQPLCVREGLAVLPYYALASGFLTGKYRAGAPAVDSPRASGAAAYLERGGAALLPVLDELAEQHDVAPAAVALAWLRARDGVVAPIASARTTAQLTPLLASMRLTLSDAEVARLDAAVAT